MRIRALEGAKKHRAEIIKHSDSEESRNLFLMKYLNGDPSIPSSYIELCSQEHMITSNDPNNDLRHDMAYSFGKLFIQTTIYDCIENPLIAFLVLMDLLKGESYERYDKIYQDEIPPQSISNLAMIAINKDIVQKYFLMYPHQFQEAIMLVDEETQNLFSNSGLPIYKPYKNFLEKLELALKSYSGRPILLETKRITAIISQDLRSENGFFKKLPDPILMIILNYIIISNLSYNFSDIVHHSSSTKKDPLSQFIKSGASLDQPIRLGLSFFNQIHKYNIDIASPNNLTERKKYTLKQLISESRNTLRKTISTMIYAAKLNP